MSILLPKNDLQDFVRNLVEGVNSDRGSRESRGAQAPSVVKAMRFLGGLLEMRGLLDTLSSQLIHAWLLRHAESTRTGVLGRREAVPLPLFVLINLERALLNAVPAEAFVIGVFLLMCWASLRWSDAQRMKCARAVVAEGVLRGFCWRTKTSPLGMPWGVLCCGFLGLNWAERFHAFLAQSSNAILTWIICYQLLAGLPLSSKQSENSDVFCEDMAVSAKMKQCSTCYILAKPRS